MSKPKNKTKTQKKNATKKLVPATSHKTTRRARRGRTEAPEVTEVEHVEGERREDEVDPAGATEVNEVDTIDGRDTHADDTDAEAAGMPGAGTDEADADDDTRDGATADEEGREEGKPTAQPTIKPELPPVGTVIEKRDRYGNVRCKCKVEEDGIRYNRQLYSSISAAALAASKDLGLQNKTQNGYTFWGLTKPRRPAADRKEAVTRAWERYVSQMGAWVQEGRAGNDRPQIAAMLNQHTRKLDGLYMRVS